MMRSHRFDRLADLGHKSDCPTVVPAVHPLNHFPIEIIPTAAFIDCRASSAGLRSEHPLTHEPILYVFRTLFIAADFFGDLFRGSNTPLLPLPPDNCLGCLFQVPRRVIFVRHSSSIPHQPSEAHSGGPGPKMEPTSQRPQTPASRAANETTADSTAAEAV